MADNPIITPEEWFDAVVRNPNDADNPITPEEWKKMRLAIEAQLARHNLGPFELPSDDGDYDMPEDV